jgi:isopenicillin N synthase-like dioxygenase
MSAAGRLSTLPIIDLSSYFTDGSPEARTSASAALHAACIDYGFFYLDISKYVDVSEPEALTSLARQFFELPQAEKDKIGLANQDGARGEQTLLGFS